MIDLHELLVIEYSIFDINIRYVYNMYIHHPCSVIPLCPLSFMTLCRSEEKSFEISSGI